MADLIFASDMTNHSGGDHLRIQNAWTPSLVSALDFRILIRRAVLHRDGEKRKVVPLMQARVLSPLFPLSPLSLLAPLSSRLAPLSSLLSALSFLFSLLSSLIVFGTGSTISVRICPSTKNPVVKSFAKV